MYWCGQCRSPSSRLPQPSQNGLTTRGAVRNRTSRDCPHSARGGAPAWSARATCRRESRSPCDRCASSVRPSLAPLPASSPRPPRWAASSSTAQPSALSHDVMRPSWINVPPAASLAWPARSRSYDRIGSLRHGRILRRKMKAPILLETLFPNPRASGEPLARAVDSAASGGPSRAGLSARGADSAQSRTRAAARTCPATPSVLPPSSSSSQKAYSLSSGWGPARS